MKIYCTQNDGDCKTCSLVNYGRDCMNVSLVNDDDKENLPSAEGDSDETN